MALADRYAVPLLAVVGILLTIACLRASSAVLNAPVTVAIPWSRGLDVVIGYQVSWILMFADYLRAPSFIPVLNAASRASFDG